MLPSALAQREALLADFFELPESGTLPEVLNFIPEEEEVRDEEISEQSAAQPTNPPNPRTNPVPDMSSSLGVTTGTVPSQPDGSSYHTEKYVCCFCQATFTKLQQHMPNHHPYSFADLLAADKPEGPDVHVCLPFMKRRARAHMIPYIVAMRYSHERYSDQTPDWVREAIAAIVDTADRPDRIDLMSQLESSDSESSPPAKKSKKSKGKQKKEGGPPENVVNVAIAKKTKDDALLAFGDSIPVTNGSSSKVSAKSSKSKKRKAEDSSPSDARMDEVEKSEKKKKRSRASPPAVASTSTSTSTSTTTTAMEVDPPQERAVVELAVEGDTTTPAMTAAHMLSGHISSLAMPRRHAKADGVKLASYITTKLSLPVMKGAVALLEKYCNEPKFELRSSGDMHFLWKGIFKKYDV